MVLNRAAHILRVRPAYRCDLAEYRTRVSGLEAWKTAWKVEEESFEVVLHLTPEGNFSEGCLSIFLDSQLEPAAAHQLAGVLMAAFPQRTVTVGEYEDVRRIPVLTGAIGSDAS